MKNKAIFLGTLLLLTCLPSTSVLAAYNSQGVGQGRDDVININDYSTNNWDRFEYNYQFESGPDTKESFGVPTQTDAVPKTPQLDNVRRNKDASHFPPSYGVFSGEIPTDQTSPYHNNEAPDYVRNVSNSSSSIDSYYNLPEVQASGLNSTGVLASTSTMEDTVYVSGQSDVQINHYDSSGYYFTEPSYYADGSIGTFQIPKLNKTVKVYEGETLENMKSGAGHFEFTSNWDGNIGIAGVRPDRALLKVD